MKKLILLALVALVAGAVFAETAPAFSGDFEYTTQFDFDDENYVAAASPDASINLNGVVDEWSSVNAEIEATTVGVQAGVLIINQFALTTDVTGALGFDGPVGVSITWGALTFQADDYSGKAGYADIEVPEETDTYIGAELAISIVEKVNVIVLVAPSTYTDWDGVATDATIGVELQLLALVEGLDINAWYATDVDGAGFNQIGLTAGYGSDMINVGAAFSMDLESDITKAGVSFQYVMDILTAGVAFGTGALDSNDALDFADTASVGLNVVFHAVEDMLDVFAAASIPFSSNNDFGIEAGIDFFLGATTYTLGYEYNDVTFKAPDNTGVDGLFFKVYAEF